MPLDPTRASMMGKLGQARRWAKHVDPDVRRSQTQPARDAQRQKYLVRAAEMEGGADLAPEQLAERATQLRKADLAAWRMAAWAKRRAAIAAKQAKAA